MDIKISKQFKLTASSSNRFDLIKTEIKRKKDTNERYKSETTIGYDMRLETCIANIISYRLAEKKETVSLSEFLKAYTKEKNKILSVLDSNVKRTRSK